MIKVSLLQADSDRGDVTDELVLRDGRRCIHAMLVQSGSAEPRLPTNHRLRIRLVEFQRGRIQVAVGRVDEAELLERRLERLIEGREAGRSPRPKYRRQDGRFSEFASRLLGQLVDGVEQILKAGRRDVAVVVLEQPWARRDEADELRELDHLEPAAEVGAVALLLLPVEAEALGEGVDGDVTLVECRLEVRFEDLAELLVVFLGLQVERHGVGADDVHLRRADEVAGDFADEGLDGGVEALVVEEPVLHVLGERGQLAERLAAADCPAFGRFRRCGMMVVVGVGVACACVGNVLDLTQVHGADRDVVGTFLLRLIRRMGG